MMNFKELAAYIGVSRTTLYRIENTRGLPPYVRLLEGGKRLWRKETVDAWLEVQEGV